VSGPKHRRKGDRVEREIADQHKALGVHAERYPLSGAIHRRQKDVSPTLADIAAEIHAAEAAKREGDRT
jgi:Holliday junction resolvase